MATEQHTEVRRESVNDDAETVTRERVSSRAEVSGATLAQRIVYYIGGVILSLLAIRFALLMLGANRNSGFVDFVYSLTAALVAPFNGIFGEPRYGSSQFSTSTLVAIVVYGLLMWGIGRLLTLNKRDVDTV
jgi:hypothetical protein